MEAIQKSLTGKERSRLAELEAVVERGLERFMEVGLALAEIQRGKLYRETHRSWEGYCRDRWRLGKSHTYRLIEAAHTAAMLAPQLENSEVSPIGDTLLPFGNPSAPTHEAQVRPLSKLKTPAEKQEAWQEANRRANGAPTEKDVEAVVKERKTTRRQATPPKGQPPTAPSPAVADRPPVPQPPLPALRPAAASEPCHAIAPAVAIAFFEVVRANVDKGVELTTEVFQRFFREAQVRAQPN